MQYWVDSSLTETPHSIVEKIILFNQRIYSTLDIALLKNQYGKSLWNLYTKLVKKFTFCF